MDPSVVRGLEDRSPDKRLQAVERLRASVRDNNGHFLVGSLKRAFQTLEPLLVDTNPDVRLACTSLLSELIPELAKGDELETYINSMLPLVVQNIRSVALRPYSELALKSFVKHTGNLAAVALLLQQHGTRSSDSTMREAAVRFMPVLVQQVDKGGVDSRLLVLALVERLEDPEGAVVTETIKALLGIRAMLGETARKYIDSLKLSERRPPIAAPPSMTVEVARPNEVGGGSGELGFGIVPEELMKALHVEDWKVRAPAVEGLLQLVSSTDDLSAVVPHVSDLVQLLIALLNDPNFKISLTSISIIGALVARLGPKMGISNLQTFVGPMAEKFADKKIVIRQETMKVMVKLMRQLTPRRMTEMVAGISGHKNSFVREECIQLLMLAVIEYGAAALDMQAVVRIFRDGLFDVRDKVRFMAMEAFTLLRAQLGQPAVEQFLVGIGQDLIRPLHSRFLNPRVPTVGESGLIDYCLTRPGPDSDTEMLSPGLSSPGGGVSSPGSVQSMGSVRGQTSSAAVGQRPRHQSAQPGFAHKQIPWKVPNLRSRAGPTAGGGRRHRSAAAIMCESSGSSPMAGKKSGTSTPDELGVALSPASCPPELGAGGKPTDLFGEETAPPHMSDEWQLHEGTDMQVEEAMRGLYSSWEAPSSTGGKPRQLVVGSELLMGSPGTSWQSLSPTTPSSSIFPNQNLHDLNPSPSPVPSCLPEVDEGSEYQSNTESVYGGEQAKISLWLPSGKPQQVPSPSQKPHVWDHFGQTAESMGWTEPLPAGDTRRMADLRTLKSKHKPVLPRHSSEVVRRPSGAGGLAFETGSTHHPPAQVSALNIGDAALSENEMAMPSTRKLTGRVHRNSNNRKKDGATPREAAEPTPRDKDSAKVIGMGIEGSSFQHAKSEAAAVPCAAMADLDSRDLPPLNNPTKELEHCLATISSDKWDTQLDALTKLRQLAVNHPETLKGTIGQVSKDVLNLCNNLRSNLAKNGMRCVCDLFESLGRVMDPHIDGVVRVMMNKLTEASGFINGEAERVLDTMVKTATDTKVLQSVMAMHDHRHPIIRGKAALFADRCCEKMGGSLATNGMLDQLVKVVLACASDSSQEARTYGKMSIWRLSRLIPNELERAARRVLSASQMQKLEQTIADTSKHGPPSLPGRPRGGFQGMGHKRAAREHSSAAGNGAGMDGLSIDTVNHRRHGSVKAGDGRSDEAKLEELAELHSCLKSVDWQVRLQAIDRLADFVQHNTSLCHSQVQQLFDHLEPRLSDSNVKVNLRALETLQQIIPHLAGSLDGVLLELVRVIASTIASSNRQVQLLGGAALDTLFGWTDKANMIIAMTAAITHGNQRVKTSLLDKLTEVVHEVWVEKPQAVSKTVLPLAFQLVDDSKLDVRAAVNRLLIAMNTFMGEAFAAQLEGCSVDCKLKVQEAVNSKSGGTRRTPR